MTPDFLTVLILSYHFLPAVKVLKRSVHGKFWVQTSFNGTNEVRKIIVLTFLYTKVLQDGIYVSSPAQCFHYHFIRVLLSWPIDVCERLTNTPTEIQHLMNYSIKVFRETIFRNFHKCRRNRMICNIDESFSQLRVSLQSPQVLIL